MKNIVDKQRYWTGLVEVQEIDLFRQLLKMSCNIISFDVWQAFRTQGGIITSAEFTEQANILRPKNLKFNRELWPALSTLLGDSTFYKMFASQQPALKKLYRETYDQYLVIYGSLLHIDMSETFDSRIPEDFDNPISHNVSCEPGKDMMVFSGLDYDILRNTVLTACSLQLEPEHVTPE